jgi:hypothetical protein
VTFFNVLQARATPTETASSKLVGDEAMISVTRATVAVPDPEAATESSFFFFLVLHHDEPLITLVE